MSRTRRRTEKEEHCKRGDYVIVCGSQAFPITNDPEITWKDTADRKKWHKPSKKAKVYLHKGRKAKLKQALRQADDYDNLPVPKEPKSDVWNYN